MASVDRLLNRRDLDFLLFDWLQAEQLCDRPRFAEHSRETFAGVLELAARLAAERFLPHNRASDLAEPKVGSDGRVVVHPDIAVALREYADAGLLAAGFDEDAGGGQIPRCVATASTAWFVSANVSTTAYLLLSQGVAHLLLAHGSPEQVERYVRPILAGRFTGTMCLSEPQAGSSLGDITTKAAPQPDGSYRLTGTKMWISGGEHEMTENIVHLVLAKIPGGPAGTKGISLFVVPKVLLGEDGSLGERNDVSLVGLNHKMGYRGATNTQLTFGDGSHRPGGRAGAVGYLVGAEHTGLATMFTMMNEARIGVGLGATALGYRGYLEASHYARERAQGRALSARDQESPMVPIVQHPDVRRMLLAAKSYVEGALALVLFCGRLVDDSRTEPDDTARREAQLLLELLTPVAKAWPSQWCLAANDLAIQVLGGAGYTRDFPVEQLYRDNRLNAIHEGTNGIQALDLLGRRAIAGGGASLRVLIARMLATAQRAGEREETAGYGAQLSRMAQRLGSVTATLWAGGDPDLALANAHTYLEAFGHVVVAWLWLEQRLLVGERAGTFEAGKRAATAYFYAYELPAVAPRFDLLESLDRTVLDVDPSVL